MSENREILRTPEAAKYIGVKTNTLEGWRCQRKGPKFHKVGKNVVYFRDDLDGYLASRGVHTIDSAYIKKDS